MAGGKTSGKARSGALALGLSALLALAACGPDEATLKAAEEALADHARMLEQTYPEFQTGFWKIHEIEYVNVANNVRFDEDHQLALVIVQADRNAEGAQALTEPSQLLTRPREFYLEQICPGQVFRERFGDELGVYIKLYSQQFNQFYRIDCGV